MASDSRSIEFGGKIWRQGMQPPETGELAAEEPKPKGKRPWSKPSILPLHRIARVNTGDFVQALENEEASYRPS